MKNLSFTVCLPVFLLLCACNIRKEAVAPDASQAEELHPINLGVMSTMDGFPFILAEKQGIYDSLGLKVNIVNFDSANDRDAAFTAGHVDGIITDYTSAALLQARHPHGLSLVMKNDGYLCFIAGAKSQIKQLAELKEKNIAISGNTVVEYATDILYSKANIKVSETNRPEIAPIPLRLNMIRYGQIDASFLPDPYATIAMATGNKSLISTRELGVQQTGTAFSGNALKEKETEIRILLVGYNLGVEYIRSRPQSELVSLIAQETGIAENLAGLIALPMYTPAMRPNEKDLTDALNWLKAKKKIPGNFRMENLTDTTFAAPNNKIY